MSEIILYSEIDEGTADRVRRSLSSNASTVVRINSPGGLVHEGLAVYNLIRSHRQTVTVHIDGLAASIASLIAMAGDRILMASNAMMMVHAPWMPTAGNAADLRRSADLLDKHQAAMVTAYTRGGATEADVIAWMAAETWFSADEALAAGLVDEITGSMRQAASFDLSRFRNPPPQLLEIANMADENKTPAAPGKPTETPNASQAAVAAERKRATEIMACVKAAKLDADFATDLIAEGMSIDQARAKVIDTLAEQQSPEIRRHHSGIAPSTSWRTGSPTDQVDDFHAAASDALLLRAGMRPRQVHAAAQDVARMSMRDLAQACLNRSGARAGFRASNDPIKAAMTTSDFPSILEDALHKTLRMGFETEPASHVEWIGTGPVQDFKENLRPLLGSAPELQLVLEGGEYTHGSLTDDAARYVAKKYGRIIALTWETLINDDLGAFLRAQPAMGQAARRREADVVYDLLASNPTMQDDVALFHADHGNLASAQSGFDVGALSAGRLLMRKQVALGGGLMSLVPRVLLVPAELESEAEVLLRASTLHVSSSTNTEGASPDWISRLSLSVEPRLADDAFYLIAAPTQADFLELGTFDGSPMLTEEESFDSDVMRWKVRHTFGVGALDWRGAVKVPLS